MKTLILLIVASISLCAQSQKNIEKGKYISSDKLKYLIIKNDSRFEYISYLHYSPYTIEEKRKSKNIKETKIGSCGTIGYLGDIEGTGEYKIIDGKIFLDFEIDFSNISQRNKVIDFRLVRGMIIEIDDLEKIRLSSINIIFTYLLTLFSERIYRFQLEKASVRRI
ncbi:hypothetical protein BTO05_02490 [Winogradskyella sp. PC-19]|uniref:hypothetical protein n=1 Tax=unclassified Winogradskyella TaxID=2615021 RepID=UPI000B3C7D69|nr:MULTISPECIES: hypothetical protein [unclassified Winogradskyella]ARV08561.1 hypothetical protein BTO05_02490 [Winogradskyella sp. PC-19]